MTKKRPKQQKRTAKPESESPQEASQEASKRQKTATAPTRRSERVTRSTKSLKISSGSSPDSRSEYEVKDLPRSSSLYDEDDMETLNVTFVPASNVNEVIPDIQATEIPQQYFFPNISSDMLRRPTFDVDKIEAHGSVRAFFYNLHRVAVNANVSKGTAESKTDTLVNNILTRVLDFQTWPLTIRVKESFELKIAHKDVTAIPEYVVDKKGISMIVVEDKHLRNIRAPEFGEAQMMVELLACASENVRDAVFDQTLFLVRVVSSYVTFYKCKISKEYWPELNKGIPKTEGIEVFRWPKEKNPTNGLDLLEPAGRRAVLTALAQIRQFILQYSNTTTASQVQAGSSTTTSSQVQAGSSTTTSSQVRQEPSSKSEGKKPVGR